MGLQQLLRIRRNSGWNVDKMKIQTQNYNDITVVELQGEFSAEFVKPFQETVTAIVTTKKTTGIVIDMTNVGFIDSQGLEQLVWLDEHCRENNCRVKLAGLDENCEKILEITRLQQQFDAYSELSEAFKSFV